VDKSAVEPVSGADAFATYTFNTGVAKYTFCRCWGCTPIFHLLRADLAARDSLASLQVGAALVGLAWIIRRR
jgi:hypothetical protein